MNWKLSNLISAGTGICGGSAVAAIAPVIDADDDMWQFLCGRIHTQEDARVVSLEISEWVIKAR